MINVGNIPDVIALSNRGVVWRLEQRNGKLTKPPYIATDPTRQAKSNDPRTWRSFHDAVQTVLKGDADGAGFVLGDGFAGVDLDDCRNPETGAIAEWAQRIIDRLASYTEVSPSHTGVKIFVRVDPALTLQGRTRKRPDGSQIELYVAKKYFTVTGDCVPGTPAEIHERTAAFIELYDSVAPAPREPKPRSDRPRPGIDDFALVTKATSAANGASFRALFDGDTTEFQHDHSRADLALCAHLAFWTGGDAARMDRLFRLSGLMREKWDERRGAQTYGDRTIDAAIAGCRETYDAAPARPRCPVCGHARCDNPAHIPPLRDDDERRDESPAGAWAPSRRPDAAPATSPGLNPDLLTDATIVIAEGQAIARDGVPYLVHEIVPAYGELGLLVAFSKVGKTTFGQQLGAAVAMGRPFLDRDTRQVRVLMIAAEDPKDYTAWLSRHLDVEPGRMTFYRGGIQLDAAGLAAIATTVREGAYGLVMISTWQSVVRGLVKDENDNAGTVRVVENVKAAARHTAIPWLIDAHSGKAEDQTDDADPTRAMRGASAAGGAADYTLSLRYANGAFGRHRRLSGKGRFVSFAPVVMDWDPTTSAYAVLAEPKTAMCETTWALIRETGAINTSPASVDDIAKAAGLVSATGRVTGAGRRRIREALFNRDGIRRTTETRHGKATTVFSLVDSDVLDESPDEPRGEGAIS